MNDQHTRTPRRERMSPVDTAWLRMEQPTNLMMITGVMMLDGPLDIVAFKRLLGERLLRYPRFRQRPVEDTIGAYWEEDPYFDIDAHVRRVALPGARNQTELEALVGDLASSALDRHRPMWQFHVVEGFDGGSAIVSRIHHCYADGIALIGVLHSLTDDGEIEAPPIGADAPPPPPGDLVERLDRLYQPFANRVESTVHKGFSLWEQGLHLALHPSELVGYAREGVDIAAELARLALMPDDPATSLRGRLGSVKRAAWADAIPLAEVKAVGKVLGATVNDVLMTVAAGAIGSYLDERGETVDGMTIRASVPVDLRRLGGAGELGNFFGIVMVPMPIGMRHPLERLYTMRANMRALKSSRQPMVVLGLLAAVGTAPGLVEQQALSLLSRKASTVLSNVPGPREPRYLCGRRIRQQLFWVPQSGSIGIGISILTYDGSAQLGLIADRNLIPEPKDVAHRFTREFDRLVMALMMDGPVRKSGEGDSAGRSG